MGVLGMDERGLVVLKRKLEALGYTDRLDAATAPLVARILSDLTSSTDSYRSVKLQSSKYAQEIATFNTKASGGQTERPERARPACRRSAARRVCGVALRPTGARPRCRGGP
jgi:hypothetical protein